MIVEPVAIGVTGHRRLTADSGFHAALDGVLDRIEQAFPGRSFVVVSPLAEGADQLVALAVMERLHAGLIVPLPLPVDEYLVDFNSPEARTCFSSLLTRAAEVVHLPPAEQRAQAYRLAGRYVLERAHILIAVWDGQPANGIGGTAEIVAEARLRGSPLAWIYTANGGKECAPAQVTFERFPDLTPRPPSLQEGGVQRS